MAQFDLYAGLGDAAGYVVDVQADFLDRLDTRVVIPLLSRERAEIVRELTPVVEIGGEAHVLLTQELSAIPRRELRKKVGSLAEYRDEIRRALDILLVGF
ncbi:MAG: CcdB family protein [Alphaproteobacteria bacterium]|nr:CcdB family protein [Alphaproteobacteria bacterium]